MSQVSIFTDLFLRDQSQVGISSFENSVAALKTRLEAQDIDIALVAMDGVTPQYQQIKATIESTGIDVNLDPDDNVSDAIDRIRAEVAANPVVVPVDSDNEGEGEDDDEEDDVRPVAPGGGGGRMMGSLIGAMLARRMIMEAIRNFELDNKLSGDEDVDDPLKEAKDKLKELNEKLSGLSGLALKGQDWLESAIGVIPSAQELPKLHAQIEEYKKAIASGEDDKKAQALEVPAQKERKKEAQELSNATAELEQSDRSPEGKRIREIISRLGQREAELQAILTAPAADGLEGFQTKAGGAFPSKDAQEKYVADTTAKERAKADLEVAEENSEKKKRIATEVAKYLEEANRSSLSAIKNDTTATLDALDAEWKKKIDAETDPKVKLAMDAARSAEHAKIYGEGQQKTQDIEEDAREKNAEAQKKPKEAELDRLEYEIQQKIKSAGEDKDRKKSETDLGNAELAKFKAGLQKDNKPEETSIDSYIKNVMLNAGNGTNDNIGNLTNRANGDIANGIGKAGGSDPSASAFGPASNKLDSIADKLAPAVDKMALIFQNPVQLLALS